MSHLRAYTRFLVRHPLWWLTPPLLILLGLVALVFLGGYGDGMTGFVYDV